MFLNLFLKPSTICVEECTSVDKLNAHNLLTFPIKNIYILKYSPQAPGCFTVHVTMTHNQYFWQGEHQWVILEFPRSVKVSELKVQFQGGFSAKTCRLEGKTQRLKFSNCTPQHKCFSDAITYHLLILVSPLAD